MRRCERSDERGESRVPLGTIGHDPERMALAVQGARETQGAARGAPAGKLSRSGIVHWTPRLALGRRRRAAGLPGRPLERKTDALCESWFTVLRPPPRARN